MESAVDQALSARRLVGFWAMVDRSGGPDACWPWTGSTFHSGYGQSHRLGEVLAHRVAWTATNGSIPKEGKNCVCHHCDNKVCCNPAHLFLGSHKDNVADRDAKGRHYAPGPTNPARGDANGSRLHPESRPRGDSHPAKRDPRFAARLKAWHATNPDKSYIARGEAKKLSAKLKEEDVRFIRASSLRIVQLAAMFGVSRSNISMVLRRKTWAHVK